MIQGQADTDSHSCWTVHLGGDAGTDASQMCKFKVEREIHCAGGNKGDWGLS